MNKEQVKAYLERIGMEKLPELTEKGLDELIWGSLTHIPFENADVNLKHIVPSLEESDLFEKIIERKRGGYCFETNKLFLEFLKAAGFHAWPVAVRIVWMRKELPAATHRGSIVKIGTSLYYADIGYGGPGPKGVVELKEGIIEVRGSKFCIDTPAEGKWLIKREYEDSFSPMLLFEEREAEEVDYQLMNFYCARCEKVLFSHTLVCNLLTDKGTLALVGNKFTSIEDGHREEKELQTQEEILACLKHCFGIAEI